MRTLPPIFVFGSNLAGRHGAGSALEARRVYGAKYGVGKGRTGNAYALPTKDHDLRVLPLSEIQEHVYDFFDYAREESDRGFLCVAVGTGRAGYTHQQMAPLFRDAPPNVSLPTQWRWILADLSRRRR